MRFNRRLSHCKLVQLYGVCSRRSPMCLVFEFMANGCLSDYLRARKGYLSLDVLLKMCLDVSEGMAYLETSNFLHRDLVKLQTKTFRISTQVVYSFLYVLQAARNCLVSEYNEVKVSDFGMTRSVLQNALCETLSISTFISSSCAM